MIYFCLLLVNSKIQRHGSNIDKQSGHVICSYRVVSVYVLKLKQFSILSMMQFIFVDGVSEDMQSNQFDVTGNVNMNCQSSSLTVSPDEPSQSTWSDG